MIDMNKWKAATNSIYYEKWSDSAKAVIEETNCKPVMGENEAYGDDCYQTWSWAVYNPEAKKRHPRILAIILTKNGELEYREIFNKNKNRPSWFVQAVSRKTALILDTFTKYGFYC